MMYFTTACVALVASLFANNVVAHPGHDINAEVLERSAFLASSEYTSLEHCAEAIKARDGAMIERRRLMVEGLRRKRRRSLQERSFSSVLATNHHSSKNVNANSPDADIFGSNSSCILQPETTEGPYYVSGEYVRKDITDKEPGVPLTFDVQVIDTTTCQPLSNVALEAWHCNSTGVYGGIVAGGNGNQADATNINNTMLRGIQISNTDGVLQFDTIFPGHYTGRAIHIHVLAHINSTINTANNTLVGGHASHVGQLFFDQDLIDSVEKVAPYSTNKQTLTVNSKDGIFAQEAATNDPVLNYVLVGSSVSDGIFGWVTVGINPTISKNVSAAAYLDDSGGHANPGRPGGPGGPGGPPPSGFPTGAPPNATATAAK